MNRMKKQQRLPFRALIFAAVMIFCGLTVQVFSKIVPPETVEHANPPNNLQDDGGMDVLLPTTLMILVIVLIEKITSRKTLHRSPGQPYFEWLPVALLLTAVCLHVVSCVHIIRRPVVLIRNVPFYANHSNDCGPVSLAMVLHYWSDPIPMEAVKKAIYNPSAGITLKADMVWFARQRGFRVQETNTTTDVLFRHLDAGIPVILLVENGLLDIQKGHYLVAVGYDRSAVIVNSGLHKHERLSLAHLNMIWKRTNGWMLIVTPPQF